MNEYRQKLLKSIGVNYPESTLDNEDWFNISESYKLTDEFIREFKYDILWKVLFSKQVLSDEFLIEIQDTINWTDYFIYASSSFAIMKKFIAKAEPHYFRIFKLSHFNEQQINELQRILDLKYVFQKNKIKLEKTI